MKISAYACDDCEALIEVPFVRMGQDLCMDCADNFDYRARQKSIQDQNWANVDKLPGCKRCKDSGYLHRSIYITGSGGYYDPPDPNIYCTCKKGRALDPSTNYVIE